MEDNWAKNLAEQFLEASAQEKKEKRAEQTRTTREQQQRAADEKASRELTGKSWGQLRNEIKAAVKQLREAAKQEIIKVITAPSNEIKASVIGKERALKLTLDESSGVVKCEGFNGESFDIRNPQFDPKAKARAIIESLIKPR